MRYLHRDVYASLEMMRTDQPLAYILSVPRAGKRDDQHVGIGKRIVNWSTFLKKKKCSAEGAKHSTTGENLVSPLKESHSRFLQTVVQVHFSKKQTNKTTTNPPKKQKQKKLIISEATGMFKIKFSGLKQQISLIYLNSKANKLCNKRYKNKEKRWFCIDNVSLI